MNVFFKSLTAAAVAVTITATTLAAPAEAKIRGRDIAAGIFLGIAAIAVATQSHDQGPPRRAHKPQGNNCGWMKAKAKRTGSPYWWDRYDECRGRW